MCARHNLAHSQTLTAVSWHQARGGSKSVFTPPAERPMNERWDGHFYPSEDLSDAAGSGSDDGGEKVRGQLSCPVVVHLHLIPVPPVSRQIQMRMSEDPITPARGPREMQVPSAAVTPLESPEVWPSPSCRGFATSNLLRAVAGVSSRCGVRCALCAPTSTCPRSVRRPTRQASSSSDRAAARQTFLGCSCPV